MCQLDQRKTAIYDGEDSIYYYVSALYSIKIDGINTNIQIPKHLFLLLEMK